MEKLSQQIPSEHKWYIVHAHAGKERVRQKRPWKIGSRTFDVEAISDLIVPKYKEIVYKDGKKRTVEKKSFPGYLYVKMEFNKESMNFVLETPYISQFVTGGGLEPRPLTEKEIQGLSDDNQTSHVDVSDMQSDFDVGQKVLIIDGPFNNFSGNIKALYPDKKKVCVNVEIFGRITPVEIDYFKVKKN